MMTEPIQGQEHDFSQYNKYEDTFDVFINFIVRRSPTVFVLINMTLMIWLVQTIYSSQLDSIPRSIYYLNPYFAALPIINIDTTKNNTCNDDFQKVVLKTFPTIKEEMITKSNMTHWDINPVVICVQYGKQLADFTKQCSYPQQYCSGYCVDNLTECPITSITTIRSDEKISFGYEQFYVKNDKSQIFLFSKENKNSFIVGFSAQFQQKCTNDFKYFDTYSTFQEYWNDTKQCGNEGSLPPDFYQIFDVMPVKDFLLSNGLWSPIIQKIVGNSQVSLGTIELIKFNNKTTECSKVQYLSTQLNKYLMTDPLKPIFTKSILIVAFIFFTLSWAWLVGYYCFGDSGMAKNKLMILMFTIELIVVAFLYSQNLDMFLIEDVILQISNCIETQLQATSNWSFGITNSSPFITIIYACTCFLLIQLVCQVIDRNMYASYYLNETNITSSENTQRWSWH